FGRSKLPIYVLNVVYPLVPDEIVDFCAGKRAVMLVEEGQPKYLEDALEAILRRAGASTEVHGERIFSIAGEYSGDVLLKGVGAFTAAMGLETAAASGGENAHVTHLLGLSAQAADAL